MRSVLIFLVVVPEGETIVNQTAVRESGLEPPVTIAVSVTVELGLTALRGEAREIDKKEAGAFTVRGAVALVESPPDVAVTFVV